MMARPLLPPATLGCRRLVKTSLPHYTYRRGYDRAATPHRCGAIMTAVTEFRSTKHLLEGTWHEDSQETKLFGSCHYGDSGLECGSGSFGRTDRGSYGTCGKHECLDAASTMRWSRQCPCHGPLQPFHHVYPGRFWQLPLSLRQRWQHLDRCGFCLHGLDCLFPCRRFHQLEEFVCWHWGRWARPFQERWYHLDWNFPVCARHPCSSH